MKLIRTYWQCTCFAFISLGSWNGAAHGQTRVPIIDDSYDYVVLDQNIRDALEGFAADSHIVMDIAPDVRGRLKGHVVIAHGRDLFNAVAQASRSIWYYDGRRVLFRRASSSGSRRMAAGHLAQDRREQLIQQWPLAGHGVSLSYDPYTRDLVAEGPPEFVNAVAGAVPAPANSRATGIEVHRFRSR